MTRSDSTVRNWAKQLLALEAANSSPESDDSEAAMRVCEKLRALLTRLVGANGFAALLRRAIALARLYHPELESVMVTSDGRIEGLSDAEANSRDANPALLTIVACLLELLITFVGESLTLKLISDAWPGAALDEQNGKDRPS